MGKHATEERAPAELEDLDRKRKVRRDTYEIEVTRMHDVRAGEGMGRSGEVLFKAQMEGGPEALDELVAWWVRTSWEDFQLQFPKLIEYGGDLERMLEAGQSADELEGAIDLNIMGMFMTMLLRWKKASHAVGLELSVWFYTLGKMARLASDYQRERAGKGDTWHDLSVYSMIARRIQAHGRWP